MFFRFPPDARWNPEQSAVEFGIGVGEYDGTVSVSRRVFQNLLGEAPTPERCIEAYYVHRTRLELIAERKVRRRQLTDDANVEITGRDLRERDARSPVSRLRGAVFLLLLLALIPMSGATSLAQTVPAEVKKIVTFIFPADAHGGLLRDAKTNTPIPYGTGFFIGVKSDDGKGTYGYLVTAKHVLKDPQGTDFNRVYLRLNQLQGDAEFIALDLIQNGQRVVYTHTDPTVDIAVSAGEKIPH